MNCARFRWGIVDPIIMSVCVCVRVCRCRCEQRDHPLFAHPVIHKTQRSSEEHIAYCISPHNIHYIVERGNPEASDRPTDRATERPDRRLLFAERHATAAEAESRATDGSRGYQLCWVLLVFT